MIGKTFAHYEIPDLLGKGGMGEVYRARDTTLRRDVALKFLPPELARDPERCVRFDREARTLASLQHPNVAAIFGLEEVDGVRFLVMELVEGEDLAQRMRWRPISVGEALAIARQMAAGLEAAHERGIVHRDLKPANVKILDFGLARVGQSSVDTEAPDGYSPTITCAMTQTGTALGTTTYMSPEQACGEHLDKRTDVWAFGCVLYEMLAGQRCFAGDSVTDVLARIVTKEPDWSLLPRDLPVRGQELLQQTLEKNPRQRLRDMGDIRLLIEKSRGDLGRPSTVASAGRGSFRPWFWVILGLILGAIVVGSLTRSWSDRSEPTNLLSGATFTRITDFAGSEFSAAISRDGKNVAFVSDRDGQFDIWVIPVGTGQPFNLTNGSIEVRSLLRDVGFSYDGSELWVSATLDRRLRRMPLAGGVPRSWLEPHAVNVSWSPDGNQIVYHTSDPGDPLIMVDHNGSNRREILNSGPGYHQHYPTWADDGWIYLIRDLETTYTMDLWRVRPDGTGNEQLTSGTRRPGHPTPIDSRTLLFIAEEQNGAGPWLYTLNLESRVARLLSFGLEHYTFLAASANGRRLVASVATPQANLWQVPISDDLVTESAVEPFELPRIELLVHGERVRFLPDGKALIHMRTLRDFPQDFWLLDLATMEDRQLTQLDDRGAIRTFDITPDGTRIVFDRLHDNSDIVLIDLSDC